MIKKVKKIRNIKKFQLDESFKVWLLEINKNTGLTYSSLIKMLLPRIVDDTLKLTVDEIFGSNYDNDCIKPNFSVTGYLDEENLWYESYF